MKKTFIEMYYNIMDNVEIDEDFKHIKRRIQKAVDASPNKVSLEEARAQIKKFASVV